MLGNFIAVVLGVLLTVGGLIGVFNPKEVHEAYSRGRPVKPTRLSLTMTRVFGVPLAALGAFITYSAVAEILG